MDAAESAESYHKSMLYRQLKSLHRLAAKAFAGILPPFPDTTESSLVDLTAALASRRRSICTLDSADSTEQRRA